MKIFALIVAAVLTCTAFNTADAAQLAQDKRDHIVIGMAVYGTTRALGGTPAQALAAAAIVGVGKEVYDHYHPANHSAEIWDAVATIGGGVTLFTFEKAF